MIKLRGHHISAFANYHHNYKLGETLSNQQRESSILDHLVKDEFVEIYGPEMKIKLEFEWQNLMENPQKLVKIVRGFESICEICPPDVKKICSIKEMDTEEDKFTLKEYGLKLNKIYTAKELIRKIIEYTRRTGFRTPRDKWHDASDLGEDFYTI